MTARQGDLTRLGRGRSGLGWTPLRNCADEPGPWSRGPARRARSSAPWSSDPTASGSGCARRVETLRVRCASTDRVGCPYGYMSCRSFDLMPPQSKAPSTDRGSSVAVIGAGQHGRVVASVLEAAGTPIAGHYDDDPGMWGSVIGAAQVLGPPSEIPPRSPAIIAIGDNRARQEMAGRLDLAWVTVIHPFSWLHPGVSIGSGTVVCSGVTAQVGADIGRHVILNNSAGVGHDARVGDYAHLTVAHLGGAAQVDDGALLGVGSVVAPRVRIGAWATVGAGAVVISDVDPAATVVGNPARGVSKGLRY